MDDKLLNCQACGYQEIGGQPGFALVQFFDTNTAAPALAICPQCGTVRIADINSDIIKNNRRPVSFDATPERNPNA